MVVLRQSGQALNSEAECPVAKLSPTLFGEWEM